MLKVLIAAVVFLGWVGVALAEKRVALVIGNSSYKLIPALANSGNDARLMASSLEAVGFDVVTAIDLEARGMRRVVVRFIRLLRKAGRGSTGLFYYSGHSAQAGGMNYLVPLAAEIQTPGDLDFEALSVSQILSQMEDSGSRQNIVILDASRTNPFRTGFRSAGRGLAPMKAAAGSIIIFAQSPGKVATDGDGSNSPFASALADALRIPNVSVERMFDQVQSKVSARTNGDQVPWKESALRADFGFAAPWETSNQVQTAAIEPKNEPPSDVQSDMEVHFWNSVKDSNDPLLYEAYISRFPGGTFAGLARFRLQQLNRRKQVPTSSSSTTRGEVVVALRAPAMPATLPAAIAPRPAALPGFPWPPPEPSVQIRLPRQPFAGATDLGALSARLIGALRKAGYWEHSFHRVPNGFALVTRLERINADGSKVTEDARYRLPGDKETFSLAAYIKRLFFAQPGFYRLIVFIVTDRPFAATGDPIKEKQALKLLRGGANVLPPELSEMEFGAAYGVDALIYEFRKNSGDENVSFLLPGRISPLIHLRNAGLSAAFGLQ